MQQHNKAKPSNTYVIWTLVYGLGITQGYQLDHSLSFIHDLPLAVHLIIFVLKQ